MLLGLYRIATDLGSPLLALHLNHRVGRGKEEALRLGERSGRATIERPDGPLLGSMRQVSGNRWRPCR